LYWGVTKKKRPWGKAKYERKKKNVLWRRSQTSVTETPGRGKLALEWGGVKGGKIKAIKI